MINKLKELRAGGEEEGFTLIELMIVVVIIGILAAIAIPIFANQQKNAINAGLQSDVKNTNTNIVTALVKAPTADVVGSSATVPTAAATTGGYVNGDAIPVGTATAKAVVTDSASTLTIGGKWDGYTIIGKNTGTGASVTYNSADGTTKTTGN